MEIVLRKFCVTNFWFKRKKKTNSTATLNTTNLNSTTTSEDLHSLQMSNDKPTEDISTNYDQSSNISTEAVIGIISTIFLFTLIILMSFIIYILIKRENIKLFNFQWPKKNPAQDNQQNETDLPIDHHIGSCSKREKSIKTNTGSSQGKKPENIYVTSNQVMMHNVEPKYSVDSFETVTTEDMSVVYENIQPRMSTFRYA